MLKLIEYATRRTLVFGLAGALGAFLGEILSELLLLRGNEPGLLDVVLHTAWWAAFMSLGIILALLGAHAVLLKKPLNSKLLIGSSLRGIITGAAAGAFGQLAYSMALRISPALNVPSRIFGWGILGLGIGWGVSLVVPNYPKKTAMIAGSLGGAVGCIGFLLSSTFLPDTAGRLLGSAIIGFCVGLMISYFEESLRKAWLTVIWGKYQKATISLGEKPIVLGSSPDADIYLGGAGEYPAVAAIVKLDKGKITIDNKISNQSAELRDGSQIRFGRTEIIANTRSLSNQ